MANLPYLPNYRPLEHLHVLDDDTFANFQGCHIIQGAQSAVT